jgi:hypothetical protein
MSGGRFEYMQYRIYDIADDIKYEVDKNGKQLSLEELKDNFYWLNDKPTHHYEYPKDIIEEFKKGIKYLRLAQIYAHRIDWLLSSDDGEDSFRKRLKNDLQEFKKGK